VEESEMKVLVYGAGVLGSLYAARLQESGHDVTVLARGKRFDEIEAQGIVLEHALTGIRSVTAVAVTRELKPDDSFDLVLVVMRRNQVADVLPALAANKGSAQVVFMVNNPLGYGEWLQAVGRDRLLVGFAGAGGTRVDGVVYYHVVSPLLQPTTFGEPEGGVTERVRAIARVFRQAGFPTAVCPDMAGWQKTHVAWVSAMANGLYMAGGSGDGMASRPDVVRLTVRAIREGFVVLRALGVPVTPGKLRAFEWIPMPILVAVLRAWARTRHFDTIATRHTLAAFDEMEMVSTDFQSLARSTTVSTPALDTLHSGLANWTSEGTPHFLSAKPVSGADSLLPPIV
jgi:2-dehydropantoate 2-reductase